MLQSQLTAVDRLFGNQPHFDLEGLHLRGESHLLIVVRNGGVAAKVEKQDAALSATLGGLGGEVVVDVCAKIMADASAASARNLSVR